MKTFYKERLPFPQKEQLRAKTMSQIHRIES
jgi:hypothetical protein